MNAPCLHKTLDNPRLSIERTWIADCRDCHDVVALPRGKAEPVTVKRGSNVAKAMFWVRSRKANRSQR